MTVGWYDVPHQTALLDGARLECLWLDHRVSFRGNEEFVATKVSEVDAILVLNEPLLPLVLRPLGLIGVACQQLARSICVLAVIEQSNELFECGDTSVGIQAQGFDILIYGKRAASILGSGPIDQIIVIQVILNQTIRLALVFALKLSRECVLKKVRVFDLVDQRRETQGVLPGVTRLSNQRLDVFEFGNVADTIDKEFSPSIGHF